MSLSQMSTRERSIVIILGIIIVVALIGIGLLAARLLVGDGSETTPSPGPTLAGGSTPAVTGSSTPTLIGESTPAAPAAGSTPGTPAAGSTPGATTASITPVAPPELQEAAPATEAPAGAEPAVVAEQTGFGPLSPVVIASQPLQPGHAYRIEIRATDGSTAAIHGSWGQMSDAAPFQAQLFEGQTPYVIELPPPAGALQWSCSVSAAATDLAATGASLVIQILDVTGTR